MFVWSDQALGDVSIRRAVKACNTTLLFPPPTYLHYNLQFLACLLWLICLHILGAKLLATRPVTLLGILWQLELRSMLILNILILTCFAILSFGKSTFEGKDSKFQIKVINFVQDSLGSRAVIMFSSFFLPELKVWNYCFLLLSCCGDLYACCYH